MDKRESKRVEANFRIVFVNSTFADFRLNDIGALF
jgi:hypothetical protein